MKFGIKTMNNFMNQTNMTSSDLRIGNYVIQDGEEIHGIVGLTLHKFELNQIKLEPIVLTEDWLVKFGFSSKDYKKGYIGIEHKAGGMITDFVLTYPYKLGDHQKCFIWEHSNWKYNTLEYVHELQNLFYILTSQELTIKNEL